MKNREGILLCTVFSSVGKPFSKNHYNFLPQGREKHLTLLTSLPEKARVWDRRRNSKIWEKKQEKDESIRKL